MKKITLSVDECYELRNKLYEFAEVAQLQKEDFEIFYKMDMLIVDYQNATREVEKLNPNLVEK